MPESRGGKTFDPMMVLEPDTLLPEQMDETTAASRNGEFALLWAVFTDGVRTYCREVLRGGGNSLACREVERWIFRPNSDALTSFSNLCELFGIDPRRLRRALLRFREHPSQQILEILSLNAA